MHGRVGLLSEKIADKPVTDLPLFTLGGTARLIGRKRELRTIEALFDQAAHGEAGVALLTGDPGIGKTRLLEAFAGGLSREAATVVRGAGLEAEGMPPYLPFLQALRQFIAEAPEDEVRRASGEGAASLGALLPELEARIGGITPHGRLPAEQARLRLFEAVAEFLSGIGRARPLLFIIDNLDDADAATQDLLCHVMRHTPQARMLVLAAARATAAPNPAYETAMHELTRLRRLARIRLDPLGPEEVTALAETSLAGPVAPDVGERLHMQSEGNPFFAEELVRDWLEAGVLLRDPPSPTRPNPLWRLAGTLPASLPASIVGAVRQRVARQPPEVVDLMRVASVIGHTFDVGLLARLVGMEAEVVGEQLLHAEKAGLLAAGAGGTVAFTHQKVRECLYSEVSSGRRRRLHSQIGATLRESPETSTGRAAELAFHFARSDDPGLGIHYSCQAAEAALRSHAPEQALVHYRVARGLLTEESDEFGEVAMGLARAALEAGNPARAAEAFRSAQAWFFARADLDACARSAHGLGRALWQLDDPAGAEGSLRQALDWFGEADRASKGRVEALVDAASLLGVAQGRLEEAVPFARQAIDRAGLLGDAALEASACRSLGFLLVLQNEIPHGEELLERGLNLALGADDAAEAAACCAGLAQLHAWSGDFRRSHDISLRREALARSNRLLDDLGYVYSWLAFLEAARGDWEGAANWLAPAAEAVERLPSERPAAFLSQVRGYLAFQRMVFHEAQEHFAAALSAFRTRDPMEYVLCMGMEALTRAVRGDGLGGRRGTREQEAWLSSSSLGRLPAASVRSTLALTYIALAEAEGSQTLRDGLQECRGQHHWFLVDRVLAELALLGDEPAAAIEHLRAAQATAEREGLLPELARTHLARADAVLRLGGPDSALRARQDLQQALEVFDRLRCGEGSRLVRERLATLPPQPTTRSRGRQPGNLSDRELEVLRLMAIGRTNRQIATALAISESTVAKHITSIYGKIGVDNRAGATAYAIRHGLA